VKLCRTSIALKALKPCVLFSPTWALERRQQSVKQSEMRDEAMPCLFSRDGSDVMLIVERDSDGALLAFDGSSASWEKLTPTNQLGSVFYVWNQPKEEFPEDGKSWLLSAVRRFKPAILAMLAFSFLGNIAALTLRFFCHFRLRHGNWHQIYEFGDHAHRWCGHCDCHKLGAAKHSSAHDGLFRARESIH